MAEPAESFFVTLTNPGGATLGALCRLQVEVVDNDLLGYFVDGFETGNTSRWSNTVP